jgi:hypothetical protein
MPRSLTTFKKEDSNRRTFSAEASSMKSVTLDPDPTNRDSNSVCLVNTLDVRVHQRAKSSVREHGNSNTQKSMDSFGRSNGAGSFATKSSIRRSEL